jgi:hypothetical protein
MVLLDLPVSNAMSSPCRCMLLYLLIAVVLLLALQRVQTSSKEAALVKGILKDGRTPRAWVHSSATIMQVSH